MEHHPQPLATRLRRPAWRDPRLGVGLLLMAVSVALGAWTVAAASRTTPVYAARTTLFVGHDVRASDLVLVEVSIGPGAGPYLTPAGGDPSGVVLRTLTAGELVPASAVAPTSAIDVRPVVLDVTGSLPAGVTRGAVVDVWWAPRPQGVAVASADAPDRKPRRVAPRLDVVRVSETSSIIAGAGTTAVEVLVPEVLLGDVLEIRGADGQVVLVPVLTADGNGLGVQGAGYSEVLDEAGEG